MRRVIGFILVCAILFSQAGFADGKDKWSTKSCGLEKKLNKTVYKLIDNRDELNLTDTQVAQIKELSKNVQKSLIKQDADIKTLKVEINTLMWEAPFSEEEVNPLIAEKYELEKRKMQFIASSLAQLHKSLSKEQLTKL